MPGRRYMGSRRRRSYPRAIVNSIKNVRVLSAGISGTQQNFDIAIAKTTPSPVADSEVSHGCIIKAIWCSIDGCGLGGTGVLNNIGLYLMKNPGANLTEPGVFVVGTSNEKKFVFKQWQFMAMRNQDGNTPFHWEGWIKVPKRYQRIGTDDTITISVATTAALTGHFSGQFIYKWYR